MNPDVYRKVAIERLSSPEQLDSLVRVTSPRGWLALIGIGLLIAAALYWGIFGTMSTMVSAQGVLVRPGGLKGIHATMPGTVSNVRVTENETVKKGDVIAWLEQPELLEQIRMVKSDIAQLSANSGTEAELQVLQRKLQQLQEEYAYAARVISPYNGTVVEVMVEPGQSVASGREMVRLETHAEETDELIAVLYVPVQLGKQILPGMEVRISPTTVNREEYGSLVGSVVSVSDYPVTEQGMLNTLGNEGLVRQMAAQGVSLEVRVNLVPNDQTYSGYSWTTLEGPPHRLNSGMLVSGTINISDQRPIGMVIPQLK